MSGQSDFTMGANSRLIMNHSIDVWNDVIIGSGTRLAGKGSQIWPHGSLKTATGINLSVVIGDDCYVGSGVMISPGVKVRKNNLLGLGTVLSKSIRSSKWTFAGNPGRVVKRDIDWRECW